ncbi:MAG: hypothetical protein HY275_02390 [Gemmatimonadetes bacterium]|nr:hypothetical protein [Gemmatimonadota bacterium]
MTSTSLPLLFGRTVFHHWDHHWFAWTPGHPDHESFEVMSIESPGAAGRPLVWAFFTERTTPKRQVHYVNRADLAATWGGAGAHFREMHYVASGAFGAPRGLDLAFADGNGDAVDWRLRVDPHDHLEAAGLTDQRGHEASRFLLLFFRRLGVRTADSRLSVGGRTVGVTGTGTEPFVAAYSFDILVASILCGHWEVREEADALVRGGSDRFTWDGTARLRGRLPGFAQAAAVEYDGARGLREVAHHCIGHTFRLAFSPPVPWSGAFDARHVGRFAAHLDAVEEVLVGDAAAWDADTLLLRPTSPAWAAASVLQWRVGEREQGRYVVRISRGDPDIG